MKERKELCLLGLFALLFLAAGVYYLYFYHWEERSRQQRETQLAGAYLSHLEQWASRQQEDGGDSNEEPQEYWMAEDWERTSDPSWVTWTQRVWYEEEGADYTPDYGQGVIQCVLEMPSAGICRGIYVGDWETLSSDLEQYMLTAARPDYIPGVTHMCIYGSTISGTDLGFGSLKDAQLGDAFALTCETGRYEYRVTNIFAADPETAAQLYVDDFYLPKEMCYLITNGTGEYSGQDILVEGTLEQVLSLKELNQSR